MSFLHMILQVAAVLVLMIGLIVAMGYLGKRTQAFGLQGGKHIRCLQTLPLGAKEKAVLVEIEGKKLLLGVTAHQVSILWNADAEPGATRSPTEEREDEVADNFAKCLKKIVSEDAVTGKLARHFLDKKIAC